MSRLSVSELHLLRLIRKDKGNDGWTNVSDVVYPIVKNLPSELVIIEQKTENGWWQAKLTDVGETVLNWT